MRTYNLSAAFVSTLPPLKIRSTAFVSTLPPLKIRSIGTATVRGYYYKADLLVLAESLRKRKGMMSTSINSTTDSGGAPAAEEVIVQYVVLRRDLIDTWPMGSVVTQGCHASVAAVWENKDDPHTLVYCSPSNIDSMAKVTLEVKGETQLVNLSEKLKTEGITHKLWIEEPENMPTCLATKPYPKSNIYTFFRKLKLCK